MRAQGGLATAVAAFALGLTLALAPGAAKAEDAIDRLQSSGQVSDGMARHHAYSDFTDPLGRFLDFLAAGALVDARAIQPDACATWLATRRHSAFSGKVRVWDTEIDLDRLCPGGSPDQ